MPEPTRMPSGLSSGSRATERERADALFLNLLAAGAPAIPKVIAAGLSGSVTL